MDDLVHTFKSSHSCCTYITIIRRGLCLSPHRIYYLSGKNLRADALLTELSHILTELDRTLLSYAAPYFATPHPTELRRTLLSYTAPY